MSTAASRVGWAKDIAATYRVDQRQKAASAIAAEAARQDLRSLITAGGVAFLDSLAELFTEAVQAFTDERFQVDVTRITGGGVGLRSNKGHYLLIRLDSPLDHANGLHVTQYMHCVVTAWFQPFTTDAGELRVLIGGESLTPSEAARAFAEPFLQRLCQLF